MHPYLLTLFGIAVIIALACLGSYLSKRAAARARAHRFDALGPGNEDLVDLHPAALLAVIRSLRRAIRTHRDERGHDRCWLDDVLLYDALPERPKIPSVLPPRGAFLANCERYHEHRHDPSRPYLREAEVEAVAAALIDGKPPVRLPVLPNVSLLPGIDSIPAKDLKEICRYTGQDLLRFEAGRSDAHARVEQMRDSSQAYAEGYLLGVCER